MYPMYPTFEETHPTAGHPQPRFVSGQATTLLQELWEPLIAGLDSTLEELVDVLL